VSEREPFIRRGRRELTSLKHPIERGEHGRRGSFDRLAQRASYFSSSPVFFILCVSLVLAWIGGYAFGASTAYEQATGTGLTAITLLLVALLKNAELATGMLEAIREEGQRADPMLERAIGIDEEL
jgi:low affinity Fe/Cu permease